jgi:hypothetical protein
MVATSSRICACSAILIAIKYLHELPQREYREPKICFELLPLGQDAFVLGDEISATRLGSLTEMGGVRGVLPRLSVALQHCSNRASDGSLLSIGRWTKIVDFSHYVVPDVPRRAVMPNFLSHAPRDNYA